MHYSSEKERTEKKELTVSRAKTVSFFCVTEFAIVEWSRSPQKSAHAPLLFFSILRNIYVLLGWCKIRITLYFLPLFFRPDFCILSFTKSSSQSKGLKFLLFCWMGNSLLKRALSHEHLYAPINKSMDHICMEEN